MESFGSEVRVSPNIWFQPVDYELENQVADPDGRILAAMAAITNWQGKTFLDIGCGTGFHLPIWAQDAAQVIGVEPNLDLLKIAARRTRNFPQVRVLPGSATKLPVANASVAVAQARWAYFFGPGCEAGLDELARVLQPGGVAFVIDNDPTRSEFGGWFRRGFPEVDPVKVKNFWTQLGWQRQSIDMDWLVPNSADLATLIQLELPTQTAQEILAELPEREYPFRVSYAVNLWWRQF